MIKQGLRRLRDNPSEESPAFYSDTGSRHSGYGEDFADEEARAHPRRRITPPPSTSGMLGSKE